MGGPAADRVVHGGLPSTEGETFALAGRRGVFTRVTDFAYVPRDATATVTSQDGGRFALCGARASGG